MGASQSHGRHNYIPCHLIPHLIIRESECEALYWTINIIILNYPRNFIETERVTDRRGV